MHQFKIGQPSALKPILGPENTNFCFLDFQTKFTYWSITFLFYDQFSSVGTHSIGNYKSYKMKKRNFVFGHLAKSGKPKNDDFVVFLATLENAIFPFFSKMGLGSS